MIRDYLLKHVNFSEEEINLIIAKFESIVIEKNELFLREGEICDKVAFIESGAMILSQTLETGNEHILDFFLSGDITSDFYSFLKCIPTETNIKALKKRHSWLSQKKKWNYFTIPYPIFKN